ncbi:MAG: hypothetical protein HYZ72_20265 [Deltaproteobacteria bacterium]|nr:hypothetical protein [Deltaproteobacteria bacterium]
MSAETIQHAWEWLLGLSKIQLILLGGGISLLVAVSKVMRFLFLLGLLVVFLTVLLPEIVKRYEHSPLPAVVKELVRKGAEATKDPVPAPPEPKK